MLGHTDVSLWDRHDLAMLDLDGVVYIGSQAVAGAVGHLESAREHLRLAFITNNASRPPSAVADHLTDLGITATADDVVTSAQAAARVVVDELGRGTKVVLLGAAGLAEALRDAGLEPVEVSDAETGEVGAVVTGYGPDVRWHEVMRAAVLIRDGLWWVASNTDMTIPTAFGTAPGHGVLVETLRRFSEIDPVVAGKPARPLLDETMRRVGGERPLMVGDRLDTDIAGGRNAGIDSLLVLTGVTGLSELVQARPEERPTYVASDLGGLAAVHPEPEHDDGRWRVRGWTVAVDDDVVRVEGDGEVDDWWRAVACAAWQHLDDTGQPVTVEGLRAPVGSPT